MVFRNEQTKLLKKSTKKRNIPLFANILQFKWKKKSNFAIYKQCGQTNTPIITILTFL